MQGAQAIQTINQHFFTSAMFIYLAATFFYIVYSAFKFQNFGEKMGKLGSLTVVIGVLVHTLAIILRWWESYSKFGSDVGHAPLSNMYESMVFFSWCIMLIYIIFEKKYKMRSLGSFVSPLGFLGIAVVSLFGNTSAEISPLVPALKSIWLEIHVITCFIGYGAFSVAFGASIAYLLRKGQEDEIDYTPMKSAFEWLGWGATIGWLVKIADHYSPIAVAAREYMQNSQGRWVEKYPLTYTEIFTYAIVGAVVGFALGFVVKAISKSLKENGRTFSNIARAVALFVITYLSFVFLLHNLKIGAGAIKGYSALAGVFTVTIVYFAIQGLKDFPSKQLEEISYKTIAIGFPFLTAGIITGAIWANSAWGTYWSWDPKETWSLITWFIYAAFLHARYTQGWRGRKMAVISICGFIFVVFTYWGVNYLLAGLHSYG